MNSYIILAIICVLGLLSKNKVLFYATLTLMIIKILPYNYKMFNLLKSKGSSIGIYILTLAILVPIAIGTIGVDAVFKAMKSKDGITALLIGSVVSIFATKGIMFQENEPQLVIALTTGIILGIVFFKGSATGPIIASGMTYYILQLIGKK